MLTFKQYIKEELIYVLRRKSFLYALVYVHNLERSLRVSTEEQIVTVCVCKFIRVLLWNSLRPQLDCCVLRKENVHPPMGGSSILSVIKNHDNIMLAIYPWFHHCNLAWRCPLPGFKFFQSTQLRTEAAMKGWRKCQSKRLEASSNRAFWQEIM